MSGLRTRVHHPGNRDRVIEIQELVTQRGTFNELQETWETFARPWANVIELRGSERYQAEQVSSNIPRRFSIDRVNGINENMSIRFEGKRYKIRSIEEIGNREGLLIEAVHEQAKPKTGAGA